MVIVADFECTIDEPVKVIHWCWTSDGATFHHGEKIEDFLSSLPPQSDIYFHNLSYDGSFLIYHCLQNGTLSNQTDYPDFCPTIQGTKEAFTLIKGMDYWNFFDTMQYLTGSLAMFGEAVHEEKGDTKANAMFTNDEWDNRRKQQEEKLTLYCEQDVNILWKICQEYHVFHLKMMAPTKASLAFKGLTTPELSADTYVIRPAFTPPKPTELTCMEKCWGVWASKGKKKFFEPMELWEKRSNRSKAAYQVSEGYGYFDWTFYKWQNRRFAEKRIPLEPYTLYTNPTIPYRMKYPKSSPYAKQTAHVNKQRIKRLNQVLKPAYKGGLNYVNPYFQNQWIEDNMVVLDVNSMYPWIYSTMPLPDISKAKRAKELKKHDLGFVFIEHLKAHTEAMPLLKLKTDTVAHDNPNVLSYLPDFEATNVVLTNLEWQYCLEHYVVEEAKNVQLIWMPENTRLMHCLKAYCAYWYERKKNARNATEKYFAKLMLNSLYGKFGQFESAYRHIQYTLPFAEETISTYDSSLSEADLAVASYITAYGRVHLANCINTIGLNSFCYCDTDSLHFINNNDRWKTLPIGKELGQWKIESEPSKAKFIKCKTYGEVLDGQWKSIAAGFTSQIPIEQFYAGAEVSVRRSALCEGGTIITDRIQIIGRDYMAQLDNEGNGLKGCESVTETQ